MDLRDRLKIFTPNSDGAIATMYYRGCWHVVISRLFSPYGTGLSWQGAVFFCHACLSLYNRALQPEACPYHAESCSSMSIVRFPTALPPVGVWAVTPVLLMWLGAPHPPGDWLLIVAQGCCQPGNL